MSSIERRLRELEATVSPHGSALVAFSGGVDSSLALAITVRALPKEKVLAVTSNNETYLPSELDLASDFAETLVRRASGGEYPGARRLELLFEPDQSLLILQEYALLKSGSVGPGARLRLRRGRCKCRR